MEPMKPMAPMTPIEPMAPMEPMRVDRWWPEGLGEPSTSGAQDGLRYAAFPDRRRLLVERDGALTTYDTGHHRIGGVSQRSGSTGALRFTSQDGAVDLDALTRMD